MAKAKGEIGWKRVDEDGDRLQVRARKEAGLWRFWIRGRRYERWLEMERGPIEDWKELADAIERRVSRGLSPPQEIDRIRRQFREEYPEYDLSTLDG